MVKQACRCSFEEIYAAAFSKFSVKLKVCIIRAVQLISDGNGMENPPRVIKN